MPKTITVNGCPVTAFRAEDGIAKGWCLRIGTNVYDGFKTRKDALAGATRYV